MNQIPAKEKACMVCPCMRYRPEEYHPYYCQLYQKYIFSEHSKYGPLKIDECLQQRPQIIMTGIDQTIVVTEEVMREINERIDNLKSRIRDIEQSLLQISGIFKAMADEFQQS